MVDVLPEDENFSPAVSAAALALSPRVVPVPCMQSDDKDQHLAHAWLPA